MTDSGTAPRFAPYVATDSGRTVDEIFDQVNTGVWLNYGPDLRVVGADKPVAAPLKNFESLLESLTALPHAEFVDHVELHTVPCPPDRIRIALRHDIDSDIVGAVAQAEIEAAYGVRANWVVLHTAPYYGTVDPVSARFVRHDAMATVYRKLQDFGHEVSLHTDPLHLYQDHGIDGAQAVATEIEWLRSHGISIQGTTAHNFRARYGAENYEVFTGVVSPRPGAQPADARWVEHDGKVAPLRVLDDKQLGLVYEGNQPFWDLDHQLVYASVGADNMWYWADRRDPVTLHSRVDQDRLLRRIRKVELGTDVVLVVHPEYLAVRAGSGQPPLRRLDHITYAPSPAGWTTYAPDSIVAESSASAQTCAMANEWGMLDAPISTDPSAPVGSDVPVVSSGPDRCSRPPCVLMVGSQNLDGRPHPIALHANRLLAKIASEQGAAIRVVKLAHPGFAIDRQWAWIQHAIKELDGSVDVAVLSISANELDHFGIDRWISGQVSGIGRQKGRYLAHTRGGHSKGQVREYSYPRQRNREPADWQTLLSVYRWVFAALRKQDIEPIVLIEDIGVDAASRRQAVLDLSTECGVAVADPTVAIAEERSRLGLGKQASWDLTSHRVAANVLARSALPRLGIAAPVLRFVAPRVIEHHRTAKQVAEASEARAAIGLLDYPSPFTKAIAFAAGPKTSPANAAEFARSTTSMIERLGLDYGEGIPLADHHQRYSRGRVAASTSSRAILTHDLQRDNAPLDGQRSWMADTLAAFHRGDIDYLHGISAWGARSLPLNIGAGDKAQSVLRSPFVGTGGWDVPFALNASDFPIALIAIETTGVLMPPTIDAPDGSPAYERIEVRALTAGMTLGLFTPVRPETPSLLGIVTNPAAAGVPPQHTTPDLSIAIAPVDLVSAAAHNLDPEQVGAALRALDERFDMAFDLLVANRDYTFYGERGLQDANGRFERIQERRDVNTPLAVFGAPAQARRAESAIADRRDSPAYLGHALGEVNPRFISPHDLKPAEGEARRPAEFITRATDRSGTPRRFVSREPADTEPLRSRLIPPDTVRSETGDEAIASHAADHFDGRIWLTRASVLAGYHNTLGTLAARVERSHVGGTDIVEIAPHPDASEADASHLFGVSFSASEPTSTVVRLAGSELSEIVRWVDRDEITLVPCGIRWPLIDTVDPAVIAGDLSDLRTVVTTGNWTWTDDRDQPGGRLQLDDSGHASLGLSLGALNVAGAQVASAAVRISHSDLHVRVRFITGDDSVFELSTGRVPDSSPRDDGAADAQRVGQFACSLQPNRWTNLVAPFWGFTWEDQLPTNHTIRRLEVVASGPPGESVSLGQVWLGRPRAETRSARSGVLLGGDALGRSQVMIRSIKSNETWLCPVEADGLFVSPRLAPGAYAVRADTPTDIGREHTVQLMTTRFDLCLGDFTSV